jgi:serpin B
MNRYLGVLAAVSGLTSLIGCGGADSKPGGATPGGTPPGVGAESMPITEVQSDAPRVMADASEAARTGASEEGFGLDLLRVLPGDSNLAFSPHSISTAFAMLTDAATGETLTQIADTLHFGVTDEAFQRSQDAQALALAARNRAAIAEANHQVDAQILSQSNDIWTRKDAPPIASYLDTLAQYYGAGIHEADFMDDPDGVRVAINQKVSDDTHALIPELIPPNDIDPDTVAVLTNALYFKAPWASPFNAPTPGNFHERDGSVENVDMLVGGGTWAYYAGDGFVSVAAPYYGDELELMLIVPDLGTYDAFRSSLTNALLDEVVAQRSATLVTLTLPKFSVKSTLPATAALKQLGLQVPFLPGIAEFPKLATTGEPVYITDVLHQATLAIDEKGTEASAATAIIVGDLAIADPTPEPVPIVVNVDRPFLFALRDNPTGALLFLGQVVAP